METYTILDLSGAETVLGKIVVLHPHSISNNIIEEVIFIFFKTVHQIILFIKKYCSYQKFNMNKKKIQYDY